MKISNHAEEFKIRNLKLFTSIILLIPISIILVSDIFETYIINIHKAYFLTFFLIIYAIFWVIISLKKHYYVYFSDEDNKICFRFYPLRIIGKKFKSYEIQKKLFAGYEIIYLGNKIEHIVIKQKTKDGIFKYPPISLSAVSEKDKNKIKEVLNSVYSNAN